MKFRIDPGGLPERKTADVPAVAPMQMREIQRVAQEDYGIDILQITENAGRSAAELAVRLLGGRGRGQRIVVLAGGGNKGAVGLVAARHLVNFGANVEPIFGEVEGEMSFVARRQVEILRSSGVIEPDGQTSSEFTLEEHLEQADMVIDALIGYGFEGPPTGIAAAVAQLAVAAKRPVFSLDMPTGVSARTGDAFSPAIRAAWTVALDLPKLGLYQPASKPFAGELFLADLGIPRIVHERLGISLGGVFSEGPLVRLRRQS